MTSGALTLCRPRLSLRAKMGREKGAEYRFGESGERRTVPGCGFVVNPSLQDAVDLVILRSAVPRAR